MARENMQTGHSLIYTRTPAHSATAHTWERCYEDGSFIWFVDTDFKAENLRTAIGNNMGYVEFTNSGGTTLSRKHVGGAIDSICLCPSRMGLVIISAAKTVIDGSMQICSGYSGQRMKIQIRGATLSTNNGSITLGFSNCGHGGLSGVNCFDHSMGVSLSSWVFWHSATSGAGYVTLFCPNGGDWHVVDFGSNYEEGDAPRNNRSFGQVE